MSWTSRVHRSIGTPSLRQAQDAAENLADQAGIAPGKARVAFQTVTDAALLGTVVISGMLAAVHLYKALFPRHREDQAKPEPAGGHRSPPRRPGSYAAASAEFHGGYEGGNTRSR
jgi:hypothetical protein